MSVFMCTSVRVGSVYSEEHCVQMSGLPERVCAALLLLLLLLFDGVVSNTNLLLAAVRLQGGLHLGGG